MEWPDRTGHFTAHWSRVGPIWGQKASFLVSLADYVERLLAPPQRAQWLALLREAAASFRFRRWPTSALVDRFIAILSPFGAMYVGDFLPGYGSKEMVDEFKMAIEEARALANELNRRSDPDAGERLLTCLNAAVRMGVFAFLMPDAPREARLGAMLGPLSGFPDETAGEIYRNALATGEQPVSLTELGEQKLIERLIEFCRRDFMATNFFNLHDDQEQIDASNNITSELIRILVALKERGALGRLAPLLADENQNVRLWAASGMLFVDEKAALAALITVAGEGSPISARMYLPPGPGLTNMSAKESLELWRKEGRGVYGLNPGDRPVN